MQTRQVKIGDVIRWFDWRENQWREGTVIGSVGWDWVTDSGRCLKTHVTTVNGAHYLESRPKDVYQSSPGPRHKDNRL